MFQVRAGQYLVIIFLVYLTAGDASERDDEDEDDDGSRISQPVVSEDWNDSEPESEADRKPKVIIVQFHQYFQWRILIRMCQSNLRVKIIDRSH